MFVLAFPAEFTNLQFQIITKGSLDDGIVMDIGFALVLLIPFAIIVVWISDEVYDEYVHHHYY